MRGSNFVSTTALWLVLGCSAHAASFDCAKAQTSVEKLICADVDLSKLDEDMAAAYTKSANVSGGAASIRRRQKQWLKERNACVDAACVKSAYQSRARTLAQSTPSTQGIEALYGKWEAGGKAGIAIYGRMEISKFKITWKGYNRSPRCTVSYELVPEDDAIKFKIEPERLKNLSPFKSYVLAIHGACSLHAKHFRLTLPNNIPDYLDMNEYTHGSDDTGGYSHFYRR